MSKDPRLIRLQAEVTKANITQVAKKLGLPRCTVSLVAREKYPANPENILKRFEAVFGGVHCPFLDRDLTREECHDYSHRQRPSNPIGLQHWRTCQQCSHKH